MKQKVIVIGSGFAGLSAATSLADKGYQVTLLEKNQTAGGRARFFDEEGFRFDMGPSWYWMPDVFERYFNNFGKSTNDYYNLIRLDPSYRVFFAKNDKVDLPADPEAIRSLFDGIEPGSGKELEKFLAQAKYKYDVGINDLVYRPSKSVWEFLDPKLLIDMLRMNIFQSFHKHIRKFFTNSRLLQLMEFPILFLGAVPQNTPALYSLMNYADISLGTWYPEGGMHKIIEAMVALAKEKGVEFHFNSTVENFEVQGGNITKVHTKAGTFEAPIVVAGADYHHVEQLLPKSYRSYNDDYWNSRVMAPSSLIFYLGINKKLKGLLHHNLFFDEDFALHGHEIYEDPKWPSKPLFYVSVTSQTDPTVAPEGCENVFILMPVAPGLEDTLETREKYYGLIMSRLEALMGQSIRDAVTVKKSYAHQDFSNDYNAFKGNAYGLANTLMQTAILKPRLKSKKVKNLYFTGQLTVPGPGVPPSIISGRVVAEEISKDFR